MLRRSCQTAFPSATFIAYSVRISREYLRPLWQFKKRDNRDAKVCLNCREFAFCKGQRVCFDSRQDRFGRVPEFIAEFGPLTVEPNCSFGDFLKCGREELSLRAFLRVPLVNDGSGFFQTEAGKFAAAVSFDAAVKFGSKFFG